MHGRRTRAWWRARLYLAIGVVVVLLIAFTGLHANDPCFSCTDSIDLGPLRVKSGVLTAIVGLAGAVFGLVLMVRILRGPQDGPLPWRYRDH